MRLAIPSAAIAVAACAAQPTQATFEPAGSERALEETRGDEAIDGRYIVELVDGARPIINISGYEPTVTIVGDRVHFQSQCIYADWTLKREGDAIAATPYYEPGSAMCARGLAPGETAIQDTFTALGMITREAGGGLRVDGGGHRLQLRPAG